MPNRNLRYDGPGPLGESLGRVLFEMLDTTNDGKLVTMRGRDGMISTAEDLCRRGYVDGLELFGRDSFRCNITEKGLGYGREHFGWHEA